MGSQASVRTTILQYGVIMLWLPLLAEGLILDGMSPRRQSADDKALRLLSETLETQFDLWRIYSFGLWQCHCSAKPHD